MSRYLGAGPHWRAISSIVLNWCGHVSGAGAAQFAAIQPARHVVAYWVGILELWCMSDVMENLGVPLGISGGRYARGDDGHQPIPNAVDEQHRLHKRPHRVLEMTRPETRPHHRPCGLQVSGILGGHEAAALCDEFGGRIHHLRGASARIGKAQVHDAFNELAVGSGSPADVQEDLAYAGKGGHQELCGELGIRNLHGSWQRRIDQHYRGDRLRAGGRLQDRDGTAHRVAHQNDWAAEGFVDEAVEYLRVGFDAGPSALSR